MQAKCEMIPAVMNGTSTTWLDGCASFGGDAAAWVAKSRTLGKWAIQHQSFQIFPEVCSGVVCHQTEEEPENGCR